MIYTALTRAKELAVLVGTKKALAIAIKNNKIEQRYTRLGNRLKELKQSTGSNLWRSGVLVKKALKSIKRLQGGLFVQGHIGDYSAWPFLL